MCASSTGYWSFTICRGGLAPLHTLLLLLACSISSWDRVVSPSGGFPGICYCIPRHSLVFSAILFVPLAASTGLFILRDILRMWMAIVVLALEEYASGLWLLRGLPVAKILVFLWRRCFWVGVLWLVLVMFQFNESGFKAESWWSVGLFLGDPAVDLIYGVWEVYLVGYLQFLRLTKSTSYKSKFIPLFWKLPQYSYRGEIFCNLDLTFQSLNAQFYFPCG